MMHVTNLDIFVIYFRSCAVYFVCNCTEHSEIMFHVYVSDNLFVPMNLDTK
jgi:hypothetical protein